MSHDTELPATTWAVVHRTEDLAGSIAIILIAMICGLVPERDVAPRLNDTVSDVSTVGARSAGTYPKKEPTDWSDAPTTVDNSVVTTCPSSTVDRLADMMSTSPALIEDVGLRKASKVLTAHCTLLPTGLSAGQTNTLCDATTLPADTATTGHTTAQPLP